MLAAFTLAFMVLSTALAGSPAGCCLPVAEPDGPEQKPACCALHAEEPVAPSRAALAHRIAPSMPSCCNTGICCRSTTIPPVVPSVHPAAKVVATAPLVLHEDFLRPILIVSTPERFLAPSPPSRGSVRAHLLNCTLLC